MDGDVQDFFRELLDVWNRRNEAAFANMFTADAEHITPDGEHISGRENIARHLDGMPREARASIGDMSTREYGDTAIAIWRSTVVVGDVVFKILTTGTAVKQEGAWRVALLHSVEENAGAGLAEPVLPAKDLNVTRAFYRSLGFRPWFDGKEWPGYEIMSLGRIVIHFFDASKTQTPTETGCYLRVRDADAFHATCAALNLPATGTPSLTALCDQPWGMREFVLVDPSGNELRIGHDLC